MAYDVLGEGPPLVMVHGMPSWSYLWRNVAVPLAEHFTVHIHDLAGYGSSDQYEGQDVSIPTQSRILGELLDMWGLDVPSVVGHDIGGTIVLRSLLLERRRFRRLALCDATAFSPSMTPFTHHVQRHIQAFQTLPQHIHKQIVAAHLRTAMATSMSDEQLEPYLAPWLGAEGQQAYYRNVAQLDEAYIGEMAPRYGEIEVPTLVLWGARDEWLPPSMARRLAEAIPGAELSSIPDAGHFIPEDRPDVVTGRLRDFFTAQP